MSNVARVAGQAANTAVKPLDITDVFSTYLYEGGSGTQTITNGIDLDGEGGLVWGKSRSATQNHRLYDTEGNGLYSHLSNGSFGSSGRFTSNSDGFNLTASSGITGQTGFGGPDYVSWTFRKAPKFFDVVTWTGDGVAGRTVSHNLGSVPGMIITKRTNASSGWYVYHTSLGATKNLQLSSTLAALTRTQIWNDTAPTDLHFSVGTDTDVNASGGEYVAYLFAHNDGDGGFGDGSQDIIKCGSYTGNGLASGVEVDLGFEPQWLLIKKTSSTSHWYVLDVMRGLTDSSGAKIEANTSDAEDPDTAGNNAVLPTASGFRPFGVNQNASGNTYIYMAIRRGPLAVPEDATEVFATSYGQSTKPWFQTNGWPVDMAIEKPPASGNGSISSRLTQDKHLYTNGTDSEFSTPNFDFDFQNGFYNLAYASNTYAGYMWRRAPHFFDVLAYTGNGTAGRTVSHNLGVAPEMMWVKRRNATDVWAVYSEAVGNTGFLRLNQTNAITTTIQSWNNTSPTSSDFTLGDWAAVNTNNSTYIAYLFASAPGVSKVGSYTGNGSSQTINSGFTSGARFILIKRTDSTGDWYFWSNLGGIVSGNSPHQSLNTNSAPVTTNDSIDPASSGFIVNQVSATNINVSSAEYIFYAIA